MLISTKIRQITVELVGISVKSLYMVSYLALRFD